MTPEQEQLQVLRQILSQLRSISVALVLLVIVVAGAVMFTLIGVL